MPWYSFESPPTRWRNLLSILVTLWKPIFHCLAFAKLSFFLKLAGGMSVWVDSWPMHKSFYYSSIYHSIVHNSIILFIRPSSCGSDTPALLHWSCALATRPRGYPFGQMLREDALKHASLGFKPSQALCYLPHLHVHPCLYIYLSSYYPFIYLFLHMFMCPFITLPNTLTTGW